MFEKQEEELYEHFRFVVDKGQELLRIDKFLMSHIKNASRNKIQNASKANCILVNDKQVKQNYRVKPDDVISVVMAHPPREKEIIPENIPVDVVYEDDDIIVINKKAGMVVHPGYKNYTGTLVNALMFRFLDNKNADGTPVLPCLVHRIDKNTSGLLLVTKNELAQTRIAFDFFNHTVQREYQALVWGDFQNNCGTITGNIGRSLKDRKIMTVFPDGDYGKHAVTHYEVIKRFGYVTLVKCKLETGRTHQIRAHLKFIGHPLFNDETYGGDKILKGTTYSKYKQFIDNCFKILPRQALHAKSLGFIHPLTKQFMLFNSELPDDMQQLISKWENYCKTYSE